MVLGFSKKKKAEEKELVIPLIQANRWRHAKKPEELEQDDDETDKKVPTGDAAKEPVDEAVKELLQGKSIPRWHLGVLRWKRNMIEHSENMDYIHGIFIHFKLEPSTSGPCESLFLVQ